MSPSGPSNSIMIDVIQREMWISLKRMTLIISAAVLSDQSVLAPIALIRGWRQYKAGNEHR